MTRIFSIAALIIYLGVGSPVFGSTCGGPSCLASQYGNGETREHIRFEGEFPR